MQNPTLSAAKNTRSIPVEDLKRSEAESELTSLAQELAYHDHRYYNLADPVISDQEYDVLRQRNFSIEQRFPDLRRLDSPSQRVGAPPASEFEKVKHRKPMLSLDNAFSDDDVINFDARVKRFLKVSSDTPLAYMAEPKIDGLSATLHYQDGKFVLGATRGDGKEGENITANLRTVRDIPLMLQGENIPQSVEIRGEVYMNKGDFESLNEQRLIDGENPFANPRNAAAGSLRLLDPTITARRPLHFLAYACEVVSKQTAKTQADILMQLTGWGFRVSPLVALCPDVETLHRHYKFLEDERDRLPYEIDGVVYKVNDLALQERLGAVGRSPRHSIAHKFVAQQVETVVENIDIQVGRTGVLTPVAHLRPVLVGGVMVSRASLHNDDEIRRKDVRIGDTVIIQRAGDVIPQIVDVVISKRSDDAVPFVFPTTCPVCDSPVYQSEGLVARRCSGEFLCSAQAVERLSYFVSREAFDIDGLGGRRLENFYNWGLVRTPVDLFTMEARNAEIIPPLEAREGWGDKAVANLFASINKSRTITLDRFIYALGIPQIGHTTARTLALRVKSIELLMSMTAHDLCALEGIGLNMASDLVAFFKADTNCQLIRTLLQHVTVMPLEVSETHRDSKIAGKTVVFTGVLETMSRSEAKAQAERLGVHVGSSVSKKTDYVVAGENSGSKLIAARTLDVKILTEAQWAQLIRG